MGNVKRVLLGLVALSLALTAAPAAQAREWAEVSRQWRREERPARERHQRWEHEHQARARWRHDHFGYFAPAPMAAPYCFRVHGHSAWNGWRYVWVPGHTVCR
jgi:Ni/Co efflux regulator RcnB